MNAKKLSSMLADKPSNDDRHAVLKYSLKLATAPRQHFALKAAQKLNLLQFYNYDFCFSIVIVVVMLVMILSSK